MLSYLKSFSFLLVWTHLIAPVWNVDETSTIEDKFYDGWNDLAISYYNWGTDEPDTTPFFLEQEEALENKKYKFAYNGGYLYSEDNEPPQPAEDWQKALTWALGIKGIDAHGRIYPDADCMGTLVHPKIIMTLCACVNSYYASYNNLKPEDADFLHFRISPTSDEQFDIRAPTLVASRTSWSGFKSLSGETEKFPISKRILDSPKCRSAVFATESHLLVKQYKSVVFLKVDVPISHPYSPALTPYYNLTEERLKSLSIDLKYEQNGEEIYYKKNVKFQIVAYFQGPYGRRKDHPEEVDVVRVSSTKKAMDFGSQLMGTEWMLETSEHPDIKNGETDHQRKKAKRTWLYTCHRKNFLKYKDALHIYGQNPVTDRNVDDLANATSKPDVGCFRYQWGSVCGAPPGSPLVYNDTIFGMTITRPGNCSRPGELENIFVLMLVKEDNGLGAPEQIELLAKYLHNQDVAEAEALSKELVFRDDQEEGNADVLGNIDSDLVAPIAKFLRNHQYLVRSDCVQHKPNLLFLFLTIVQISLNAAL